MLTLSCLDAILIGIVTMISSLIGAYELVLPRRSGTCISVSLVVPQLFSTPDNSLYETRHVLAFDS